MQKANELDPTNAEVLFEIATTYEEFDSNKIDSNAYFFHGFTQWIKTKPNKPYYCFNDACFATYVEIYNNKAEFDSKDLHRIYTQEADWLSKASKIFFRSQWALDETKQAYNLTGDNFVTAESPTGDKLNSPQV